ncbi:Transcriptional regulator PadR-like family protein [Amphibacillus marinus]|uniref:Transcriptional regulator PadR-like family protein n=1 Tax=Amphibacillus marinus TaxID=872970 RepID=A0A1H8NC48_9BACI|nr:helix-turn-helix transcriptional regulator [Amphibacillus marinus]SEO27019.1 Transcriptional regulator PadR-like family protein [Amphibacillus marinus]
MNDPLNNLKQAMNETVFKEARFSNKKQKQTLAIAEHEAKAELDFAILKRLASQALTGYQLYELIINSVQYQEGQLYVTLHQLELKQWIKGSWDQENAVKTYCLDRLGQKELKRLEKSGKRVPAISYFKRGHQL